MADRFYIKLTDDLLHSAKYQRVLMSPRGNDKGLLLVFLLLDAKNTGGMLAYDMGGTMEYMSPRTIHQMLPSFSERFVATALEEFCALGYLKKYVAPTGEFVYSFVDYDGLIMTKNAKKQADYRARNLAKTQPQKEIEF